MSQKIVRLMVKARFVFKVIIDAFGAGQWIPVFRHKFKMAVQRLPEKFNGFLDGVPSGDAAQDIGGEGAVIIPRRFRELQHIFLFPFYFTSNIGSFKKKAIKLRPACFFILFSNPGASVFEGFPAIVTMPFLTGCLKCR